MKMDLSKFKKIKDDKKGAILKHPDGHHIGIAKSALSPQMQEQLSKLPLHLDVGGQVPEEPKMAQPAQSPQPTIIINNGPQPQQGSPWENSAGGVPDVATMMAQKQKAQMMEVQNPESRLSIDEKLATLKRQQQMESDAGAKSEMEAKNAEMAAQAERNKVLEFNALAAQRGMAPMAVPGGSPSVPSMPAPGMVPSGAAENTLNDPNVSEGAKEEAARSVQGLSPQMPNVNAQGVPGFTMAENDPYGYKSYAQNTMEGVQGQMQGIQNEAEAQGQLGKERAGILQQGIQAQQNIMADAQQKFDAITKESNDVISDIKAAHIDPKHFINSMGAGQKISTAMGLILGGMGGGLTHQENPALKFLNQQIDRDVDAQKSNLEKSNSLFKAYQQQFGNVKDAAAMYSITQRNIMADQLLQKAEEAQDPIVKARAMQSSNALKVQNAAMAKQFAMGLTISGVQGANGQQSAQQNPALMIRMVVPEGQQKSAFDELKEAQTMVRVKDNILSAFDKINKLSTPGNYATSPIQTGRQIDAIKKPLIAALSKETAGRFTETDSKFLDAVFPTALDNDETREIKRQKMNTLVSEKMSFPMLQSYGINIGMPQQSSRFDSGGDKKIQLGAPVLGSQ